MSDNKEYFRKSNSQSQSQSQPQSIDNPWKFIVPGIVIVFLGYQMMQSKQTQTSFQQGSQTPVQPERRPSSQPESQTPVQPDSRTPVSQQNPENTSQGFSLIGTWQAVGVMPDNIKFVSKINFQPNGTFQQELTTAGGKNPYSSGIGMTSGSYKQNGQNSFVTLPDRICTNGQCFPYTQSQEFTIVNSTELSSDGLKFRKVSN
jgi:hypothetical protein